MRTSFLLVLGAAALAAGCASAGKPRILGDNPTFAPTVVLTATERVPIGVTLQLPEPAHVAMFLVRPGAETALIYASDTAQSGRMPAGSYEIATSYGRSASGDTARLIRRAPTTQRPPTQPNTRTGRQQAMEEEEGGFVLVYTSETPLSPDTLRQRVVGITVPIYDTDALNTVAKLVRSTAPRGRWAAVAVEYLPQ